ncbi:HK97 gp10 family phage protein [Bacillus thuringiensis]|uniref:HK97 gp10 family phage protein n=1 Tax=Bacillus thuringiensis TaxID=1428 RepID=UPI002D7F8C72|nr:HK97 gp10 family phage protein [Bacillus thuringiensis]MEB4894250.1 HK97 gp10 family phage protein [Bacillus thuringiensis]MEC2563231.1 HK97 gp10 family phage protein [Bacillus thuringiensis]MEC2643746.1 HK97 gp10 family phage protein [Bacillus thuringiensis]MEC2725951.1 HK97 gp10 family phage protein [Bacillus thuringiensis]MEC2749234.1 HK97 gp10 family phage protein [Bacillus thuringiensis]
MASIDSLADDIARELQRYGKEVEEKLEVEKEAVANNLVDELKQKSPKSESQGGRKYAKGWRKKKEGNGFVVHNALKPQLTHLLEKGHAKVNGGRVPAIVHIAPAEEKAVNEFSERVERAIQQ